jgi:hypothetical protein
MSNFLQTHNLKNERNNRLSSLCFTKHKRRQVGSEVINDGYIIIKTSDNEWKKKHLAIWEKANGPIPKGHVVIFADGNKTNMNLDNLLLVTKQELVVMNRCGLIFPDKDLTKIGKTIAAFKMAINKKKNQGGKYEKRTSD